MAHWLYNNTAAYKRCLALQQRKGITLKNYRMCELNWAIEYADYATIKGNQFTINTYRYAQKPFFRIYNPACTTYPWKEDKDYESCRNNYLWFSSRALVHKGLDLVIEAFTEMPDYHLTICGPIYAEKDFEDVYHKELYQTPNIHTIGWVDVTSSEFVDITNRCIGLIYPSCAEGQSGSVVNCLQAALIPIVSYESGVDIDDFGVILKNCSTDDIKNSIQMVSSLPAEELKLMSRKAWEFARANHTREKFAKEYQKVIENILNNHPKSS